MQWEIVDFRLKVEEEWKSHEIGLREGERVKNEKNIFWGSCKPIIDRSDGVLLF